MTGLGKTICQKLEGFFYLKKTFEIVLLEG